MRAPTTDIAGSARAGRIGLGAFEASFAQSRQADGAITVADGGKLVSAALYRRDGSMLTELFQNLPLPAGEHRFFVPARDQSNQPIPPGDYELRLVESALVNRYRGLAGNFATSSARADNCSWPEEMIAFDAEDRVYVLQTSFENGQGVRAFDAAYAKPRWMMPGGGDTVGWATDQRWLYYLQAREGGRFVLRKLDLASGDMGEITPGHGRLDIMAPFTPQLRGMAMLGGELFLSDPGSGTIYRGPAAQPAFSEILRIPGACSITADERSHRLWVLAAGGELVAIDPADGRILTRARPVPGVEAISARAGRLALLSTETGKIHVFDAAEPAALKPLRTIGTGDGPGGPQRPDRFWFQRGSRLPISGGTLCRAGGWRCHP